jgi:hypothetical protein
MRRREVMVLLGAMMAARALRAQQKAMPVIGFSQRLLSRAGCAVRGQGPPGTKRNRLCRRAKRDDRIPLGGGLL